MSITIVYKTKNLGTFDSIEPGQFFIDETWTDDGKLFQRLLDRDESGRCSFVCLDTGRYWTSVSPYLGSVIPVDITLTVSNQ